MKNTSAIFGMRLVLCVRRTITMTIFCFAFLTMQAQVSTGLPVIRIETQNGAPIDSKVDWTNMTSFELTDPANPENNILRENLSSRDRIRGRGNSTWHTPKRPYRVRFRENVSLFGHSAAENWVLLANWFDATQGIRTAVAFELGARLGIPFTPSYHPVDLYLNGVYQGTYMLTQHRQVAPNGVTPGPGRVEIDPNDGWLVEFDFRWDEEDEDPKFRTRRFDLPLVMKNTDFPVGIYTNQDATNFIVRDWNNFADLMWYDNSDFPENGYRDLINMESIINMFIVHVLTNNHDFNHPGSNFWHKGVDGKITAGPLWDFDLSFGAWHEGMNGTLEDLYYTNPNHNMWARQEQAPNVRPLPTYWFFTRFLDDLVFHANWRESWNNNKVAIFSMIDFIDEMANKIRQSAEENYKIWRVDEQVDFDYWVNELKSYITIRINYLDAVYNEGAPTVHLITAPTVCMGDDLALPALPSVFANDAIITSQGWQMYRNNAWVSFANPVTSSDTQLRYFATNARGTSYSNVVNITINTAPPATPAAISGFVSVRTGSNQLYSVETVSNVTSYEWTLPTGWTSTGSTNGNSINVIVGTVGGDISVRAINTCGESDWTTLAVTINDNASISVVGRDEKTIIAYNNMVQINGLKEGEIVSIYNLLGTKIYSRKASQDPEYITNLIPGIYTVIIEGTNVKQKVLIVK